MLTIGSLFSGIGGLELGLERAGLGPTVWQVEQDEFCQRVLAHHWPEAKRYGDVRRVGGGQLDSVDIICGGFPCQDISLAGKGAGLAGARSGLWSEYDRIVGELRPRYVVVENVAALLARGLDRVLGDLAALGYDAWWDCIPAAAVGAPHRRDRLYVVAWRVSDAGCIRAGQSGWRRGQGGAEKTEPTHMGAEVGNSILDGSQGIVPDRTAPWATIGTDRFVADPDSGGCDLPLWPPAPDDMHAWRAVPPYAQPAFCRVADGVPDRVARLRALGNAVVPQVAEVIGAVVVELEARRDAQS